MQIRIFGRDLFEVNGKKSEFLIHQANNQIKQSKYLPDFSRFGSNSSGVWSITESVTFDTTSGEMIRNKKKTIEVPKKAPLTPKNVYELKLLHDKAFKLNVDSDYVNQQIAAFKDKLGLIKSEEYDMSNGVQEISSVLVRLENRKKYPTEKEFYEQFPYTTPGKIADLLKEHSYLKLGQVAQFLADMPSEAVSVMKDYNKHTQKLCDKQAVFYIIADKKDFDKTEKRRDPILLAQSPFAHSWQILGAWDKEMLLLEDL